MDHSDAHNEMDNVAALAESIQPKGNTLLTTSVRVIYISLIVALIIQPSIQSCVTIFYT